MYRYACRCIIYRGQTEAGSLQRDHILGLTLVSTITFVSELTLGLEIKLVSVTGLVPALALRQLTLATHTTFL